jgi:hypothetical protein
LVRLAEDPPSRSSCNIAISLIEIIVSDIAKNRRGAVGLTGAQILNKITNDNGCLAILSHLLEGVSSSQRRMLLVDLIPDYYFSHVDYDDPFDDTADRFSSAFRMIFCGADEQLKKEVSKNFVTVVKERDGAYVKTYGEAFFRSEDLEFVAPGERALVKAHLLAMASHKTHSMKSIIMIEKIGKYLEIKDCVQWLDPIVRTLVSSSLNDNVKKKCRDAHGDAGFWVGNEFVVEWEKRLEAWKRHYAERNLASNVSIVNELFIDTIPI